MFSKQWWYLNNAGICSASNKVTFMMCSLFSTGYFFTTSGFYKNSRLFVSSLTCTAFEHNDSIIILKNDSFYLNSITFPGHRLLQTGTVLWENVFCPMESVIIFQGRTKCVISIYWIKREFITFTVSLVFTIGPECIWFHY